MVRITIARWLAVAVTGLTLNASVQAQVNAPPPAKPEPITEAEPLPSPGAPAAPVASSTQSAPQVIHQGTAGDVVYSNGVGYANPSVFNADRKGLGTRVKRNGSVVVRQPVNGGPDAYSYQLPYRRVLPPPAPVMYLRSWPHEWYGGYGVYSGRGPAHNAPMVYQPTDTTQLGYTYQRVPTWQPQEWRIPGAPQPTMWNYYNTYYFPDRVRYQRTLNGGYAHGNVYGGNVVYGSPSYPTSQPVTNGTPSDNARLTPVPENGSISTPAPK